MKSNFFIFHGTGGHPGENWFPWLKDELQKKGYEVYIPQFPNADKPLLEPWRKEFEKYQQYVNESTVIIGHSLGGLFLLRVLETLDNPIKAAVFVGSPVGVQPIKFYDSDNNFSPGFSLDWEKIRYNAKKFIVFHSDNDPYVSLGNGEELAMRLGVELVFVPNAGHFNATAGYTKFERLLTELDLVVF